MITQVVTLLSLLVSIGTSATLYGIVTEDTGNETTITSFFGSINPKTGKFTNLLAIATFFDEKESVVGGNTAFDQKNDIFYYSDNSGSAFVYAIDATNNEIEKIYASNSNEVSGVAFDSETETLLVMGLYGPSSSFTDGLVSMPTTSDTASASFLNFTQELAGGIPFAGGTVDSKNFIFYVPFGRSDGDRIAIIDLNTLKAQASPIINCNKYLTFDLTYDSANSRLFSIGYLPSSWAYMEIDTSTFACSVYPINLSHHTNGKFNQKKKKLLSFWCTWKSTLRLLHALSIHQALSFLKNWQNAITTTK